MSHKINRNLGVSIPYRNEGLAIGSSLSSQVMSGGADKDFFQFEVAEVIDVIYSSSHPEYNTSEDIGKIKIRFVGKELGKDEQSLLWAFPSNSEFIKFPIRGEIVEVVSYFQRYFYLRILNYFNKVNNNSIPKISDSDVKQTSDNSKNYNKVQQYNIPNKNSNNGLDSSFKDNNSKIKSIQPKEGDILIQGRFGNVIKIGSINKFPNIKLIVGQDDSVTNDNNISHYLENINKNKSSIWISSDEDINLNPITKGKSYYVKSAKNFPERFDKNQIIINSDRIIWNSKLNENMIFANKGIILNTNGYIAIDSLDDIGISSLSNIEIESVNTNINSKKVNIGKNADQSLVLGDRLVELLSELLDALIKETHLTGSGPSGPPQNITDYLRIKAKLKRILSTKNKTS
jgi:hypothetical protein